MSIGEKQRDDRAAIPFISFQYKVEKSEDEAYQRTKIYYGAEFLFHDGLHQIFHFFNGHIVDPLPRSLPGVGRKDVHTLADGGWRAES